MSDIVNLTIESLAFGGDGLAHYPNGHADQGKVVFVAKALPGEIVQAKVIQSRKDFDRAETMNIVTPSPDRVEPFCPVFDRCGGCQLQHLSYPAQLKIKQTWIGEKLIRLNPAPAIRPIIPSLDDRRYRYRARAVVDKNGQVGFRESAGHKVVAIKGCPILTSETDRVLKKLIELMPQVRPGRVMEAEIMAGIGPGGQPAASVVFTVWRGPRPDRKTAGRLRALGKDLDATVYVGNPGIGKVKDMAQSGDAPKGSIVLKSGGLDLTLFPGVFGQAQQSQNLNLVDTVLKLTNVSSDQMILDLMSGMGNLSLPLAAAGAKVRAVEINPLAVINGHYNAKRQGLEVVMTTETGLTGLKRVIDKGLKYDVVVADPPREGMKDLIEPLAKLAAPQIVYVSCQPSALARDVGLLIKQGYRPITAIPLDIFPQTYHMETVCLLER